MGNIEVIVTVVASMVSAIVSIIGVYRSITEREKKRIHKYYKKVVLPFISEYKRGDNQGRNWCKFVSNQIGCTDECLPPYIQYLIGEGDNKNLQAVLLNDAFEYYNNKQFWFSYCYNVTLNVALYVLLVGTIIGMVFTVLIYSVVIVLFIINFLTQITYKIPLDLGVFDILKLTVSYALAFGCLFGLNLFIKKLLEDDYTYNLSKIKKIIDKKIKRTNKKIKGVFFKELL